MKVHNLFLFLFGLLFATLNIKAQFNVNTMSVNADTNKLYGSLTLPMTDKPCPVMLFIAGSGHTDRDGNQENMRTDAYKQLAEKLTQKGIATLRYDKRGVGESVFTMYEENLRFDQFIDDAALWIAALKKDERFTKVIVAGHSEGSLIGIVASEHVKPNAFISIAGAGRSIDEVLKIQLKEAVPDSNYFIKCCKYLDTLKSGHMLVAPDSALFSLFRPSIQPYMINWIQYNPCVEIKKLKMPVLILQGENDIQVATDNANLLAGANTKALMTFIPGMNHVLKLADKDRFKNFSTYSDPNLPVVTELIDDIADFILNNVK
jgi:pimeloyl-ACP methyl ester carboxylesterase